MERLRTPFFLVALAAMVLSVLVELGAPLLLSGHDTGALLADQAAGLGVNVPPGGSEVPNGRAIGYLALVDGVLLYTLAMMGAGLLLPTRLHGRIQGGVTLVFSILLLVTFGFGFNAQSGEYGDLVAQGVIDPTKVVRTALQDAGVTVHLDPSEDELRAEFLSLDMAVAVVDGVDAAIRHVNEYGTGHTEAIVTTNLAAAQQFSDEVDAAAVMVNASTAFTDGEQFGFGAEIGISTQKLHARGPMGLPELTSTKWIVWGDGQTRPV